MLVEHLAAQARSGSRRCPARRSAAGRCWRRRTAARRPGRPSAAPVMTTGFGRRARCPPRDRAISWRPRCDELGEQPLELVVHRAGRDRRSPALRRPPDGDRGRSRRCRSAVAPGCSSAGLARDRLAAGAESGGPQTAQRAVERGHVALLGMVGGEAQDRVVAEHVGGEALQGVLGPDLDEHPGALVVQRPQPLDELHGRGDLAREHLDASARPTPSPVG